jgi:hypothetical protein
MEPVKENVWRESSNRIPVHAHGLGFDDHTPRPVPKAAQQFPGRTPSTNTEGQQAGRRGAIVGVWRRGTHVLGTAEKWSVARTIQAIPGPGGKSLLPCPLVGLTHMCHVPMLSKVILVV